MSTAIPFQELTLDAVRNVKLRARRRGIELMLRSGRGEAEAQVTPRDFRANDDISVNNGTEPNEWTPAAGTAGTDLAYVNAALGANKFLIIYGVSVVAAVVRPYVTAIKFKVGTGGANTKAEVDLQRGYAYRDWVWFLDDPVVYGPSETVYILLEVAVTWAVGDLTVPLAGLIFEPAGQTVA